MLNQSLSLPAMGAKGRPLLSWEKAGRRLVFRLSVSHSDFPLQVAFLINANLIQWLAPGQLYNAVSVDPGSTVAVFCRGISLVVQDRWSLVRPDGQKIEQQARDARVIYSDTSQTGVYTVQIDDSTAGKFAVNLFSAQESEIKPTLVSTAASVEGQGISGSAQTSRQEWWRIFALLALALLTLEWLVFHRSSLVYIAGKLNKAQ
jgi:hypothetical protein